MFKKVIFGIVLAIFGASFIACSSDSSKVEDLAETKCKEDVDAQVKKAQDEMEGLIKFAGALISDEKKEQMRDAMGEMDINYKIIEVAQDKENPQKIVAKCKIEFKMEVEKDDKMEKFEEKVIASYHYIKNNDKWELEKTTSEKIKE